MDAIRSHPDDRKVLYELDFVFVLLSLVLTTVQDAVRGHRHIALLADHDLTDDT